MRGLPEGVETILVLGASRSGRSAARALASRRRHVILSDINTGGGLEGLEQLEHLGVQVVLGPQTPSLLGGTDLVVKSPGVPGEIEILAEARRRGIPVWSEIELAYRLLPNSFSGVTGTNGKTTTTALLGHLFLTAGLPHRVAGNIGIPATDAVGNAASDEEIIVEISSFQLEDVHAFKPAAAVFLNLTPDHLDRHGSLEAYLAAKERLFENQDAGDFAIVNADDPAGEALIHRLQVRRNGPRVVPFSLRGVPAGGSGVSEDRLFVLGSAVIGIEELRIRGPHNVQNAVAAATAAGLRGVPEEALAEGLAEFEGVEHRLQEAGTLAGVTYVNDSKATNVEATLRALEAYPVRVHLILGGRDKGSDYRPLAAAVRRSAAAVYLIGEAAPLVKEALVSEGRPSSGLPPLIDAGDLERAVRLAAERAQPGDVVLLAPACASFDQYRDYEERGRHFVEVFADMKSRMSKLGGVG